MKKITLSLLTAFACVGAALAQPNISIMAPTDNSSSQLRMPNGTTDHKFLRGCHLIKASELTALTATLINSIGFSLLDGASPASSGNFTVWLENTADVTYNKGTAFGTAISGMAVHYSSTLGIPTSATASTITLNISSAPFTYTGAGIYVAYAWDETAPASNTNLANPATYDANNAGTGNGLCATGYSSVNLAGATTMTLSDFRPCVIFGAANTATNEVSVIDFYAVGKTTKLAGVPQTITAVVRNNSNAGSLSNINVGLLVTGANPTTAAVVIPALAAGSQTTVTFTGYNPTATGVSGMTVSVVPDQNNNNNALTWSQSVNCDTYALPLALSAGNYTSSGYGAGANAGGIVYAFKYVTGATSSSLIGVNCVVPSFASASNTGKQLYAALFDAAGTQVATGNTVTIATANLDVFSTYPLTVPEALAPNSTYYIGLGVTTNSYFPIGQVGFFINGFYQIPTGGGAPTAINYGYLSLEAVLGYSNTVISAAATDTRVCNKSLETTTLVATGAAGLTYSWTGLSSTAASVVVNPSITAASGIRNYTVQATDAASGCKSNKSVITISLQTCTSIESNGDFGSTINVYPNPAVNGKVFVKGLDGTNQITVYNMLGQAVINFSSKEEELTVDLKDQAVGNYLIKITGSDNRSKTIKLVNQN